MVIDQSLGAWRALGHGAAARKEESGQGVIDFEDLVRIYTNRILYIVDTSGLLLAGFVCFILTVLALMGFVYRHEFAQAVFLLGFPMSLVALDVDQSRRAASNGRGCSGEVLYKQLYRHRMITQVVGIMSIFVTAMWGMLQNMSVGVLGRISRRGYVARDAFAWARSDHITVGGAPEGFDARLILDEVARQLAPPVLHIARDDKRMAAMAEALRFFAPDMPVVQFPGWDCLPYDRVSPNADVSAARMATLAGLVHGMPGPVRAADHAQRRHQRLPARDVLKEAAFTARVDHQLDETALRNLPDPHGVFSRPRR